MKSLRLTGALVVASVLLVACEHETRNPVPGEGAPLSRHELRVATDVIRRRIEASGGIIEIRSMEVRPDGRAACGEMTAYGQPAGFLYVRGEAWLEDAPDPAVIRFYSDGGYEMWMRRLRVDCEPLGVDVPL